MTPLAHEIMKAGIDGDRSKLWTRISDDEIDGGFPDPYQYLKDVHFFDLTEVYELATTMGFNSIVSSSEVLAFLPAPRTWMEWRIPGMKGRMAFRLVETEGGIASVDLITKQENGTICYRGQGLNLPLVGSPDLLRHQVNCKHQSWAGDRGNDVGLCYATAIYCMLALINSPKLIGQRTHQPHRALERALLKQRGFAAGQFPLHAWKEIRLEVRAPKQAEGEREAHFTGRRAYHFVRQYLRAQGGRLVLVSSHWKGDAALGIERARYTIVPGQAAA